MKIKQGPATYGKAVGRGEALQEFEDNLWIDHSGRMGRVRPERNLGL